MGPMEKKYNFADFEWFVVFSSEWIHEPNKKCMLGQSRRSCIAIAKFV